MIFQKYKEKQKLKFLASILALTLSFGATFSTAFADDDSSPKEGQTSTQSDTGSSTDSRVEKGQDQTGLEQTINIMGAMGKVPISGTVSYSWGSPMGQTGGWARPIPVCQGTRSPSQNESVTYNCVVVGTRARGAAIPIRGTATGGKQTLSGWAPYQYQYKIPDEKAKEGFRWKSAWAVLPITININGYKGETGLGLGSNPYGTFNPLTQSNEDMRNLLENNSNGLSNGLKDFNSGDDTNGGSGIAGNKLCADGSYVCSSSDITLPGENKNGNGLHDFNNGTINDLTNDNDPNADRNGDGIPDSKQDRDGDGIPDHIDPDHGNGTINNGGNGANGGDGANGTNGKDGSNSNNTYGNDNYGRLIDKLLNNGSGSYNSGDNDWANSNKGGSGLSNLDSYFNGMDGNEDLPNGLTNDILGVEDMLGNGETAIDTDGDGIADSVQTPDGNIVGMEEYLANKDADGAGNGDDYYDGSGDGGFDDGNLSAIQDLMGMMDGMSDADGDGSMNGLNANDSLASRIESLLRAQPTDTDSGNGDQTASDQYLFDLAKKLLMANGMSLDDIAKGRNYDPNSAYTEPMRAWDMNRITTLLRAKKISLDGGEIRKEDAKQSISKASNRNNEISETNKANGNAVKANTSNDVGSQTAPKASN